MNRILTLLLLAGAIEAHRLPIQVYTTAQGLPRNTATCLVADSKGLLWICTSEGLVRFDGSEFRTFGPEQGLSAVMDFLPSLKGGYWLMTESSVCRLPRGSKVGDRCVPLAIEESDIGFQTDALAESADGRIWAARKDAVYHSSADGKRLDRVVALPSVEQITGIGEGPDGAVLMSSALGVYAWDGRSLKRISGPPIRGCGFGAVRNFGPHDIWVEGNCNAFRVTGSKESLALEPAFADGSSAIPLIRRRDGSLWTASQFSLQHWEQGARGSLEQVEEFSPADGLPATWMTELAEDNQGNLWGASEGLGIFRITATGFRAYYSEDGLGTARVGAIFEDLRGDLCVTTTVIPGTTPPSHLRVKNGDRFEQIDFHLRPNFHAWGWGWNQVGLQARDGDWWFQNDDGLFRFPRRETPQELNGLAPKVYDRTTGFGAGEAFRVFEDSRSDLWISTVGPSSELMRWERATERFHHFTPEEGWPKSAVATGIRETKSGAIWFGTFQEMIRFQNGRFEKLALGPMSVVRDLYIDRAGRVWIATSRNGIYRCDNPEDASPTFVHYTMREGLSSDATRSLTEDNAGFIYAGTVRAVDRIDPRLGAGGGNILHLTAADGLPDGEQNVAYRDRQGHLWFGTLHGLAEYDPSQPAFHPVPSVYIRRLRVRGEEIALPWEGASDYSVDLPSNDNQMEIEWAGRDLRSIDSLRYQYRLAGVDANWSIPSTRFSVNFANIPPGKRIFEVRAVGADGSIGTSAARLAISLEAPLWRRGWFATSMALLIAAIVYWLYNYRVHHLLAMERLRTRIATDLHDDIGASLTQISLLSEVGRRAVSPKVLEEIAVIARDMVQEMSDIVWAVSPRHDGFDAIVHRMRAFAEDAMADGDLVFDISDLPPDLPLPLECRRPLYLVFKEAVNNVVRHAEATRLQVRISAHDAAFELRIEDNGRGFDPGTARNGQGILSIRRRMKDLHGAASWDSAIGCGTRFTAILPLRLRPSLPKLPGMSQWFERLR